MTPEMWIALAALILGSGGIAGLIGLAIKVAFRFGEANSSHAALAQRVEKIEAVQTAASNAANDTNGRLSGLEATVASLGDAVTGGFDRMDHLLRNLMQGMVSSGGRGRRTGGEA